MSTRINVGDIVRLTDRSYGMAIFDNGASAGYPDERVPCIDKNGNNNACNYEVIGVGGKDTLARMSAMFPLVTRPESTKRFPAGESNNVILRHMDTGVVVFTQSRFVLTGKIIPTFPTSIPRTAEARRDFMKKIYGSNL